MSSVHSTTTTTRRARCGVEAPRVPHQTHGHDPRQRSVSRETPSQAARADHTMELLALARMAEAGERQRLIEEVVVTNMPVAKAIASRYRTRGIADDDLDQVAYLGLIKAADGFDPAMGTHFLAFAVPTIRGEIKRHFRDRGWMIRPPRRIQELQGRVATANTELSQSLGRSPRPSEVAEHLGESVEDVRETLATVGCFAPASLDQPVGEAGTAVLSDLIGADDDAKGGVEARAVLAPLVRRLPERDRRILLLRFFHGCTQEEIGQEIGVTQMQVSRLLRRIMSELRAGLEG